MFRNICYTGYVLTRHHCVLARLATAAGLCTQLQGELILQFVSCECESYRHVFRDENEFDNQTISKIFALMHITWACLWNLWARIVQLV